MRLLDSHSHVSNLVPGFFKVTNYYVYLYTTYIHMNIYLYIFLKAIISIISIPMWNIKWWHIFGSEFSDTRTKTFQKWWWSCSWGYHTNLSIDELPQSDFPFYRSKHSAEKEFFYFFKERIIPPSLGGFPTNKYGHFLRSCHEGERLNFSELYSCKLLLQIHIFKNRSC